MSVVAKVKELGKMKKRDLANLKEGIEIKQLDLDMEKDELLAAIETQRNEMIKAMEAEKQDDKKVEVEKTKLEGLEKAYGLKASAFKDNLETLKAIEQIFKIREDRKTAAMSRFYGACGVFVSITGIGLAYGSDTFGTLLNKKTLESAKTAIARFIPKL